MIHAQVSFPILFYWQSQAYRPYRRRPDSERRSVFVEELDAQRVRPLLSID